MGLFSRKGRADSAKESRKQRAQTADYLRSFVETRDAVEGYFEDQTDREPEALLLVASSGEWTRRRVPSLRDASELCDELGVPCYEVVRSGYPRSMREWNAKNLGSSSR